ncbi:MAG: DUF998 domain-containing protein [Lewinellaceae bacterium]|nr:DUF998 domain-containing protein [Lewinellaceae bacterium]
MTILPKIRVEVLVGALACFALILGEFLTDAWFGSQFPGYNWRIQSISFLGESESPVADKVAVWSQLFTLLAFLFAWGFYRADLGRAGAIIAILIALYGLGEGIGSGMFPIPPLDAPRNANAFWHDVMGGVGDTALVLLPVMIWWLFPQWRTSAFSGYLLSVVVLGLVLAGCFLLSKFTHPTGGLLVYRGLWQRLYLLNYYIFLGVLAFKMVGEAQEH